MFEPKRINNGASGFVTVEVPLDKSQTIKKGMALTPVSGYFKKAAPTTASNIAIAAEDKTTGSEAFGKIKVYAPATILFEVPYKGTIKTEPVAADMFTTVDMDEDAESIQLDAQGTPTNQFVVHGIDTKKGVLLVANNKPIAGL